MLVSDFTNAMNPMVYGRANDLKQELRKLVDFAEMYPSSADELLAAWATMHAEVTAKLTAAAGVSETD